MELDGHPNDSYFTLEVLPAQQQYGTRGQGRNCDNLRVLRMAGFQPGQFDSKKYCG
jgi:hypothetical protein